VPEPKPRKSSAERLVERMGQRLQAEPPGDRPAPTSSAALLAQRMLGPEPEADGEARS